MIDKFQELLNALGQQLGVSLHPDKRGACKLNIRNQIHVQLEYEPSHDRILMASFICDVPPGKLRENIFRDTLKANHPFCELGSFGYSERNNKLSLFFYIPMASLTGEKLTTLLSAFIEKSNAWRQAAQMGQTTNLVTTSSRTEAKPFGLKS
ncbi:MAG TPA: CesT family type III secretion system chaperone [Rhabdochlamydiaceae bacterium]|jgi:hypothetical protein